VSETTLDAITIIMPVTGEHELGLNFLRCSEQFCPAWLDVRYVVVDNTLDDSWVGMALEIAGDRLTMVGGDLSVAGSDQNGRAIEIGVKYVDPSHEWVMLVHADCAITSNMFWSAISRRIESGSELIGTCLDPIRVNAVRQSCLVTKREYVEKNDMMPLRENGTMVFDCCDSITLYCRERKVPWSVFDNTVMRYPDCELDHVYQGIPADRAVVGGGVVYLHLGRGALKSQGAYSVPGKWSAQAFIDFCETEVLQ